MTVDDVWLLPRLVDELQRSPAEVGEPLEVIRLAVERVPPEEAPRVVGLDEIHREP